MHEEGLCRCCFQGKKLSSCVMATPFIFVDIIGLSCCCWVSSIEDRLGQCMERDYVVVVNKENHTKNQKKKRKETLKLCYGHSIHLRCVVFRWYYWPKLLLRQCVALVTRWYLLQDLAVTFVEMILSWQQWVGLVTRWYPLNDCDMTPLAIRLG